MSVVHKLLYIQSNKQPNKLKQTYKLKCQLSVLHNEQLLALHLYKEMTETKNAWKRNFQTSSFHSDWHHLVKIHDHIFVPKNG